MVKPASCTETLGKDSHVESEMKSLPNNKSGRNGKWKVRLIKTILALCFYLGNLILNALLATIIHERVQLEELPLPDIAFELLPDWPSAIYLTECYIYLLNLMLLLLAVFHRNGYRITQRFCVITGIIYFLRAITMSATQLTVPANRFECAPQMSGDMSTTQFVVRIIRRALAYIPTLGTQLLSTNEYYCGDLLFSGHTINVIVGYSFMSTYLMPTEVRVTSLLWWLADFFLFWTSVLAVVLILVARTHYLVDIVFAYYVSTRTFYIYHTICSHKSLSYNTPGNFFPKFWWWPLFVFFEVDSPGRIAVVNRFHNPFSFLTRLGKCEKNNSHNSDIECCTNQSGK